MTQNIVYFTAGIAPTSAEQSQIDKLNAAAVAYDVAVATNVASALYGDDLMRVDYAAGAVPDAYSAVPVIDPDNLPGAPLDADQAVLSNSDAVAVLPATGTTPAQGSATAAVDSGSITGVRLPATSAVVTNGQVIAVTGGTVTINVNANVVTAAFTATP